MFPWAIWHYRFGSRLMGQLRYMQFFLEQLSNKLLENNLCVYNGIPFDKKSNVFYGNQLHMDEQQIKANQKTQNNGNYVFIDFMLIMQIKICYLFFVKKFMINSNKA